MSYEVALSKAWSQLEDVSRGRVLSVRFLADEYSIDLEEKKILSLSCNLPAKPHVTILILHYFIQRLKGLPKLSGEWISFKQLEGGQGYYPTFKKRVIEPILRKYADKPEAILESIERFNAKKAQLADESIVIETFDRVPILVTFWKSDEEFGPEANVLFDKNIKEIFCTEDIVILTEFLARSI